MINYLIIFLLLFLSGGVIVTLDYADYIYPSFLFFLVLQISKTGKLILNKGVIPLIIFSLLFIALFILRGETLFNNNNLIIITKVFIAIVFIFYIQSVYKNYAKFSKHLVKTIEFLITLSLITFLILNLLPNATFEISRELSTFLGVGFYRNFDLLKYGFVRNQGVFWEPGVLGVVIIIGYVHKRFLLNSDKSKWLYTIGVLSTFSFGAILIYFFLYYSKVFEEIRRKNPALFFLSVSTLLVLIVFIILSPLETFFFIGKLLGRDLSDDSSALTRFYDLYYGTLAGIDKFWFGNGADFSNFYSMTLSEIKKSKESYDGGITNSIVSMFYCYGIFFLFFYLRRLFKFSKYVANELYLFVLIALILCLMLEPLHLSLLFILMIGASSFHSKPIS